MAKDKAAEPIEQTDEVEVISEAGVPEKLTREQMVQKLKKHKAAQKVEPVTLEGMLGIGKPINFGVAVLYVPALTVKQLTNALRIINEISALEQEEGMSERVIMKIVEVIHMALQRNYPNMTVDEVAELLDLSMLQEVFRQVLQLSNIEIKNE
jgi:hypothetical protein